MFVRDVEMFIEYDSDGSRVEDIEKVIGSKALDNFGADEPDLVHVRNHNYRKDYEVLRVRNNYADLYPDSREEYGPPGTGQ